LLILVNVLIFSSVAGAGIVVQGSGATFPYPCYSQWAYKFHETTGIKINYQPIGSGAGIAQIKARNVTFAGSDVPLRPDQLKKLGLVQFPMLIGGIVPIVNLKGVKPGDLHLSPETLALIFLRKITRWNDPALSKDNPHLTLPDQEIAVVHREDGSGTTFIFTNFLSKVSPLWKDRVGCDKEVEWPTGIGAKGNEGVASKVMQKEGAIGYVEYAYALQNRIPYALIRNRDGYYIHPNTEAFTAAAQKADWRQAPSFAVDLTNQPGRYSWPIVGATFILIHNRQEDAGKAAAMLQFFSWALHHGHDIARKLHYVPLPDALDAILEKTWSREILAANGNKIWPPPGTSPIQIPAANSPQF
jgi:phosphate transport system substrate-binding protein